MGVLIYGVSDDLIEIEGDVREEFTFPNDDDVHLALSDGTLLSAEYGDNGVWRFRVLSAGRMGVTIDQAPADDEDNYSDRVSVVGIEHIRWVALGTQYVLPKRSHDVESAE